MHRDVGKTAGRFAAGGAQGFALERPRRPRQLTAKFFEEKDGSSKIISFYAKKARGLMARYAIDHGVEKAEDLKAFDSEGYRFQKSASSDTEWVFSRPQPPPPSAAKKQKD